MPVAAARLAELRARRARLEAERDGLETLSFPEALEALGAADPEVADLLTGQRNLFDARADTMAREVEQLRGRLFPQLTHLLDEVPSAPGMVRRVLRNLVNSYEIAGEHGLRLLMAELLEEVPPDR